MCGVTAVEDLVTHVFTLAPLPRCEFCMYPEERLGMELNSSSMMWEQIDDLFLKIRMCMSAGRQGTSSATVTIPMLCTVYDFCQVRHTFPHVHLLFSHVMQLSTQGAGWAPDRFRRNLGVTKERRCDATFAYQQIMIDVHREVLDYTSRCVLLVLSFVSLRMYVSVTTFYITRKVLRKISGVSGIFCLVTPREKTCLLHPVVGRFQTGDTIRVVQPAEVRDNSAWKLVGNKSCGLRLTFDVHRGKSQGTLTVRLCWQTAVYRDEPDFVERHFTY